jgi:prephenate dehydrogenase
MKIEDTPLFSLADTRIAIVGLGLMGGSLAMALRGHCRTCCAYDPDPETIASALNRQIVDHASDDPVEILADADIVILAAPVLAIIDWIERIPSLMPSPAIIMDLGSTKTQICRAFETLPPRFDPIGGHPMTGKEKSGLAGAEKSLYRDAAFALSPLPRTSSRARSLALAIIKIVGARELWITPALHDRYVAATSHVPYLVSSALALATPEETMALSGPGFLSTTRLAASSPALMIEILATNQTNILDSIANFRTQLNQLEAMLRENKIADLEAALTRSARQNSTRMNP